MAAAVQVMLHAFIPHSDTSSSSNKAECDMASEEGLQLVWEHYTEGTRVSGSSSRRLLSEFKAAAASPVSSRHGEVSSELSEQP